MKNKTETLAAGAACLPFGRFFARWMRVRRGDMLALLTLPLGFWLLILLVVAVAGLAEGGPVDPEAFAIPALMALAGGVFAVFIVGIGSAGAYFTLVVCWGHPRRYGVAAVWLSGLLYSAVTILLAAALQGVGGAFCAAAGAQPYDLLALVPPVLWALLLIGPTAAAVLVKAALRRYGPKAGGGLYLIFLFACIGGPNLGDVAGFDLRPALFALLGAALAAAAVVSSVWLLRTPVGDD